MRKALGKFLDNANSVRTDSQVGGPLPMASLTKNRQENAGKPAINPRRIYHFVTLDEPAPTVGRGFPLSAGAVLSIKN
jgi:hypothetical protein